MERARRGVMFFIRLLFSPRLWGIVFIAASIALTFFPEIASRYFLETIIAGLVIMGLVITVISLSAYQVENSKEFFYDNVGDGLFIVIQSAFFCYQVEQFFVHDASIVLPLIVAALGLILAIADLLVSAKNGASKLMEMDRDRIRTEK